MLALALSSACSSDSSHTGAADAGGGGRTSGTGGSHSGKAGGASGSTTSASDAHVTSHPQPTMDASTPTGPALDAGSSDEPIARGGPGCGLDSAAFCDTFDHPAKSRGRAGELNALFWAGGRMCAQIPSGNGAAFGIGPATVPACRAGLATSVEPDQDTIVCDPSDSIKSNYLLVATAAQNYGQNAYRIRQPFDFKGRTGKIVLDGEGYVKNTLLGWISVEVSEDPINVPGFSIGTPLTNNDEGTVIPRNAFEVQFENTCAGRVPDDEFSIRFVELIQNYAHTELGADNPACVKTAQGKLNHIEIDVSQTKIDVYASPYSDDGVTFAPLVLIKSVAVSLPFSRGYVSISVHNHATMKYSDNHALDAWIARWDNVGFDGPVISNWREYEIQDSLFPSMDSWNRSGPVVNIGYRVADVSTGPAQTLTFHDVDLTGAQSAQISLSSYYNPVGAQAEMFVLKYRLNGKAWHDRPLTPAEVALFTPGNNNTEGELGEMLDVPLSDLVQGNNTLEFVTENVSQAYPPLVANIDLILTTK
jgi:hypothetical protein